MRAVGDILRTIFIVLVASAATLFVVQNLDLMEINFLTWSLQAPRFIGVLTSLFLGVAVGLILRSGRRKAH
ncbi:MAG: hypothetical protein R3C30_16885 [Hyphomonadaceae bacterium]